MKLAVNGYISIEILLECVHFFCLFRGFMLDLMVAMTPYVDEKNITMLYDMALPWLQV